jgi:hypothetical protein
MIYYDVDMKLSHISLRVWSDAIHVGMAHRSQTIKYVRLKYVENHVIMKVEFVGNWCVSEVLCI